MALLHKLETKGFIFYDKEIDDLTYGEYLYKFGSDETTTPKGVAPRLHIRETGESFELWTWGVNGNHPALVSIYDTEKEAYLAICEVWEENISYLWDTPTFYKTTEELYEDLAQSFERRIEVISRYFDIEKVKKQRRETMRQKRIEERKIFEEAIKAEAELITPDFDFVQTISYINDNPELYAGEEKSNALRIAFLSLLHRQNYGVIKTNFWKVFRIINKRISGYITT